MVEGQIDPRCLCHSFVSLPDSGDVLIFLKLYLISFLMPRCRSPEGCLYPPITSETHLLIWFAFNVDASFGLTKSNVSLYLSALPGRFSSVMTCISYFAPVLPFPLPEGRLVLLDKPCSLLEIHPSMLLFQVGTHAFSPTIPSSPSPTTPFPSNFSAITSCE